MQVRVTAQSQPHRLRERLEEVAVSHGEEIRADVRNVRVTASAGAPEGVGVAFFCNMAPLSVRQVLTRGDGGPLPAELDLTGLEVPYAGVYDILNVRLSSNGAMRVVVDDSSRVVFSGSAPGIPAW
jgi:hypothetical protein